jgi:protein phosphatase
MEPDFFAATHQGQKREVNQDRILVSLLGEGPATVMAVADGMGGEAAGDRAAEMVVQTIGHVSSRPMPGHQDKHFFTRLESMVYAARESLVSAVADEPALASMGTTLTMACCDWPNLYVVHVGDSRCYLLRDGTLERTTEDHTVAQRFVDEGVLSEEEAEKSPMAHQLWNVVTAGREVKPERKQIELRAGDAVVLCSDGLTKHVSDSDIAKIVGDADSAETACQNLIQAANEGGGSDNIAVVVGRFSD